MFGIARHLPEEKDSSQRRSQVLSVMSQGSAHALPVVEGSPQTLPLLSEALDLKRRPPTFQAGFRQRFPVATNILA